MVKNDFILKTGFTDDDKCTSYIEGTCSEEKEGSEVGEPVEPALHRGQG